MSNKPYYKNILFLLSFYFLIILTNTFPALALNNSKEKPNAQSPANQERLEIGNNATKLTVETADNETVHIFIGGKEIMTVTEDGIEITGDIKVSGKINNIGIRTYQ